MNGFERWFLGDHSIAQGNLKSVRLIWVSPWHPWQLLLFTVAAIGWFYWNYLRDGSKPGWKVKGVLLTLRLVAVMALVMLLFQPTLRLVTHSKILPYVAVLVDNSGSMNRPDPHLPQKYAANESNGEGIPEAEVGHLTRITRETALLNHSELLRRLSSHYRVKFFDFARQPATINVPHDPRVLQRYQFALTPSPHPNSTQIGTAIQDAVQSLAGQPVAGLLVVSDGGSNLGPDGWAAAADAHSAGMNVSSVGIGDPTPTRDVAMISALADDSVRVNNVVTLYAEMQQRGYAGKHLTVRLLRDGKPFMSQTVTLAPNNVKQELKFTYVAHVAGRFVYTVIADHQPDEVTYTNNSRSLVQTVIKKRLRVLYVEDRPRWEYRYLRSAILRDTSLRFACLLLKGDNTSTGGYGNLPIKAFPTDEKTLFDYDIVILGDVPRSEFSDNQLEMLRRFVEDRGGSLLIIAGENHMPQDYYGTALEPVIPVVFGPTADPVLTNRPFQWKLTPAGERSEIMQLSSDPRQNLRIWAGLPGMYWCAGTERPRPAATVLAVNPLRSNANGPYPLAVMQSFGAGLCYAQLTDSTWEWRWKVGDRYFYRYWGQVLRALTPRELPGNSRFVQVNTDSTQYRLGQSATVSVRLLDPYYHPVKMQQVTGYIISAGGQKSAIVLRPVPGSAGLYTTVYTPAQTGHFTVEVTSPQNAAAKASSAFIVESVALELQKPELDISYLKRLAAQGGGKYYQPDQINSWVNSLRRFSLNVQRSTETDIWDSPIWLVLFVVPLSIEWLIRKRSGLL